jgi:hypothetical protein
MAVRQPIQKSFGGEGRLWGRRPHFWHSGRNALGKKGSELWGQRPHNARVGPVEAKVAIELAAVGVAHLQPGQFGGQRVEQPLAVGGAVVAPEFVLGDVASDEPVAHGEAEVDRPARLRGGFRVNGVDRFDQVLEREPGRSGSRRLGCLAFPGHSANPIRSRWC